LKVHPASFSILRSKGISHISTPIAGDVLTVLHNIFLVLWTEYPIFFSKDLVAKPYTMHPKSRTKQSELVSVVDMKGLIFLSGSAVAGEVREV